MDISSLALPLPWLFLGTDSAGGRTGCLCVSSREWDWKSLCKQAESLSPLQADILPKKVTSHESVPMPCMNCLFRTVSPVPAAVHVCRGTFSLGLTQGCACSSAYYVAGYSYLPPVFGSLTWAHLHPLSLFLGLLFWSYQVVPRVDALLVHMVGCFGKLKRYISANRSRLFPIEWYKLQLLSGSTPPLSWCNR